MHTTAGEHAFLVCGRHALRDAAVRHDFLASSGHFVSTGRQIAEHIQRFAVLRTSPRTPSPRWHVVALARTAISKGSST